MQIVRTGFNTINVTVQINNAQNYYGQGQCQQQGNQAQMNFGIQAGYVVPHQAYVTGGWGNRAQMQGSMDRGISFQLVRQ